MTAPDLPPLPPVPPGGPIPGTSTTGGPSIADPTGLTFDRSDLGEPAPTRTAADGWSVTGRGDADPLCGHLTGEPHDDECEFWRGVVLGEFPDPIAPVLVMRPFDLRALAAAHITAVEWDRRERGAA